MEVVMFFLGMSAGAVIVLLVWLIEVSKEKIND